MIKRIAGVALTVGLMVASTSVAAVAAGPGNGSTGCVSTTHGGYKNPGGFLKAMTVRDGHFQNTVDLYSQEFVSVGDLIDKKCGA